MTTNNPHSFHKQRLLQNAHALHPDYYAQASNRFCINKQIPAPTGNRVTTTLPESEHNLIPEIALPHFPASWYEPETILRALPESDSYNVSTAPAKSRMVWKPGHGAIEKVDKLTGEIMHLAEEFIDKNKGMHTQVI